jgi:RNA polymerase sigma-70 factor, ECF subfamily
MKETEQKQIFENWLRQYKALLFKVVRVYAFTDDDRDDLFQEIAIQMWHSIPNFRKESAESTWIYRVALNTAMRWTRKERRHHDGRQPVEGIEHLLQENVENVDERLIWLYAEIAKLPEIDRSLTLLMLDGFSYKEMAEMTGITDSNIGVKIHRIKKHLIEKSEKYEYHGV